MDIEIRSRNVKVPRDVRSIAFEKIGRLEKYLGGIDRAEISFREEKNPRISDREVCEVRMYGSGRSVRAKASSAEQLAAVDVCIEKLKHELEKVKGKSPRAHSHKSHHGNGKRISSIVKTKSFNIEPMSADAAVGAMEQVGHDFYLFTNEATGESAVVYRREDGEIGLIDAAN